MLENDLLSINVITDSKIEYHSLYTLAFFYSHSETVNENNSIVLPFENIEFTNLNQNDVIQIILKLDYLKELLSEEQLTTLEHGNFNEIFLKEINIYLEQFLKSVLSSDTPYQQFSLSMNFISILINNLNFNDSTEPSRVTSNKLIDIQKYIFEYYDQNITLGLLGDRFHYSPTYLSKLFKKELGIGFADYLKNIRLDFSIKELLHTNKSITDISLSNGFGNSSSFNRVFKKEFEISPTEYRQNNQQEENSSDNIVNKEEILERFNQQSISMTSTINSENNVIKQFSPLNKVINIKDPTFLENPVNQKRLTDSFEQFKTSFIRYNFNVKQLLSSEDDQLQFINLIELLSSLELNPYISLDLTDLELSSKKEITNLCKSLEDIFVNIIQKYHRNKIVKWYLEFKIDPFNEIYSDIHIDIVNSLATFLSKSIGFKNIVVYLGHYDESILSFDYESLNYINNVTFSFDLTLESLNYSISEIDQMTHRIKDIRKKLSEKIKPNTDIIINSFEITDASTQTFNDGMAKGSYLLDFVSMVYNCFKFIGLKTFFDQSNVNADNLLYGGQGILTSNGLTKNSGHSLAFLRRLGDNIIHLDKGIIVSKKNYVDYVIVLSNFTSLSFDETNSYDTADHFNQDLTKKFKISLKNIRNGDYKLKHYYSSRDSLQLENILEKFSGIKNFEGDELRYISYSSMPQLSLLKKEVTESSIDIEIDLKPNEYLLIYMLYQY